MIDGKVPIIVGAAQYRQGKNTPNPLHPLGLMEEASRRALIGRLRDGSRCLAHVEANAAALLEMEKFELIGKTGRVRFHSESGLNQISFDPDG